MTLDQFTRQSASEYLHSIVFVDDEIYSRATGQPETVTLAPRFRSPFAAGNDAPARPLQEAIAAAPVQEAIAAAPVQEAVVTVPVQEVATSRLVQEVAAVAAPYHPKQILESFAREGMVCALYEPAENFETGTNSQLFKLCARADVVIFDWDLYKRDGTNLLPLITNLVRESETSVPHHVRLFVIYTTKPNLGLVSNTIFEHLSKEGLTVSPDSPYELLAGATRVITLGKPGGINRTPDDTAREVSEADLANRTIEEFSKMHSGILPSYALHGLASVRRNAKRILDKFHGDMDGAFLLHRASLLDDEDAFDQLPDLLAEEALAVLMDEQVSDETTVAIAEAKARSMVLSRLDWPQINGMKQADREAVARRYLSVGPSALEGYPKVKKSKGLFNSFHAAMGCDDSHADQRLAALFNLRSRYLGSNPPNLEFGAIVRVISDQVQNTEYSICLMPICDGVRLNDQNEYAFPFWKLMPTGRDGINGRGIVIQARDGQYLSLLSHGRPRDMLWLDQFQAAGSGHVSGQEENGTFYFQGRQHRLEWVAQLKPTHAQRVAHDIGQAFSRVGVVEAEWLRLLAGG